MNKNMLEVLTTYDENLTNDILEIRSDTIYPLTSSVQQKKYVFRLEPSGYLDENSLLLFKLQRTGGANNHGFRVNCFNGALGGIRRCVLSVGDFTLNDVDDVNEWATLENMMTKNRDTLNRFSSHYYGNQLHTTVADVRRDDVTHGQGVGVGEIIPDSLNNGVIVGSINNANVATTGYVNIANPNRVNSLRITDNANNNIQHGVLLGDILPCLKGRRIPLFMFDEYRIYIEVYFNDESEYINYISNSNYSTGQTLSADNGTMVLSDVKLQIDYILPPASVIEMEKKEIEKDGGYVMDFYDVSKIQKSLPAVAGVTQQRQEFRIGQADRELHKIYMIRKFTNTQNTKLRRNALLLGQRCDSVNNESINFNINGEDEYEYALNHDGFLYDELSYALGKDLEVERPMFFNDDNTEHVYLASSTNPLQGTYKPLGISLRNGNPGIMGAGRVIGKYPIVVKYTRTGHDNTIRLNKTNEAMNVNFHVMATRRAVIQSGVKGNDVRVTY
jgi:hypothetical protein